MLTKQEMFDRAVSGLRAQEWRRAMSGSGIDCEYLAPNGDRCAWGHVDHSSAGNYGDVEDLNRDGIGLASELAQDELDFAMELQMAHDRGYEPCLMRQRLLDVALDHGLTVPEWLAP